MSGLDGLTLMAMLGAAVLAGMAWGVKLEDSAVRKAAAGRRRAAKTSTGTSSPPDDKPAEKPPKKRLTASKLIAAWMLGMTTVVSAATLYLMRLCVLRSFTGALYPLSALITLCQAGNAVVLAAYYNKSKAENTKGGITYDSAFSERRASDIFDTV